MLQLYFLLNSDTLLNERFLHFNLYSASHSLLFSLKTGNINIFASKLILRVIEKAEILILFTSSFFHNHVHFANEFYK